ncbi:MAG: tetratricopeptide repeat protein [Treponema sp.]|jgi:tetratricopeptide (TPR) repeat protein|nr:tetratricopeptide repeat protein [Treponema sp.]
MKKTIIVLLLLAASPLWAQTDQFTLTYYVNGNERKANVEYVGLVEIRYSYDAGRNFVIEIRTQLAGENTWSAWTHTTTNRNPQGMTIGGLLSVENYYSAVEETVAGERYIYIWQENNPTNEWNTFFRESGNYFYTLQKVYVRKQQRQSQPQQQQPQARQQPAPAPAPAPRPAPAPQAQPQQQQPQARQPPAPQPAPAPAARPTPAPAPTPANTAQAEVHYDRAFSFFRQGNRDAGIVELTEAIRLNPNNPNYYEKRGDEYVKKGDYDRAIADYTQSIQLGRRDSYTWRAVAYNAKGDWDRAIADATESLKTYPDLQVVAWYNRAFAHMQKGNFTQARYDVNRALQGNSSHAPSLALSAELRQKGH